MLPRIHRVRLYIRYGHSHRPQTRFYTQQKVTPRPRSQAHQSTTNPQKDLSYRELDDVHWQRVISDQDEMKDHDKLSQLLSTRVPNDTWERRHPLQKDLVVIPLLWDILRKDESWRDRSRLCYKWFLWRFLNMQNNTVAMYRLASDHLLSPWARRLRFTPAMISASATRSSAYISPFRNELLEVYKRLNSSIAAGDIKTIKMLTSDEMQDHSVALARKQRREITYKWIMHKEVKPCKIIALRVERAHHGFVPPKTGSRLGTQLLAKFDTLQSVQMFNRLGQRLRADGKVATESDPLPEPTRVIQYLVFERKFWMLDGFIVRGERLRVTW